jgi:predicted DsbA family dithiol-disulfide isomerase
VADVEGVPEAVVEALFRAYFTEGRDISHAPMLFNVAVGAARPEPGR